jgi:hypothetical protein
MDSATIAKLAGIALVPCLGLGGALYRRFRKSGTDEVESFSRYLAQGVKFYVGRVVRRKLAGELTLRQYAGVHLRSTATEMMVPATYPMTLKTDDVFVPLLLRDASRATIEYQDLLERRGTKTVIIGEPGSGKSSLMKRTFRDACRRAIADPGRAPVPILFELRNLSRLDSIEAQAMTRRRLFDECIKSLDEAAAFKTKKSIEHLRHGGGFLVLLDGLDEVPREAAAPVTQAIVDLSDHLALIAPSSSMIVSTRTQHYVSMYDRQFKESFGALQIRPFSIADVYRFLLNWPFEADRAKNITRLFSRIRQLPSLTEMCTNPLALSMFVARDQQTEGAVSPETRTEFYASLIDELLINRRFRREETPVGRQRLRRTREQILGRVCLDHLLDPDESLNSISERRMLESIESSDWTGDPAELLEILAVDTGLFSAEREGETYRFMHLTLCEFMAARAVVNGGMSAWDKVISRLREDDGATGGSVTTWESRLGEMVAFTCGLAPHSLGEAISKDLTTLADDGLLLRAAVEAQSYGDIKVSAAVSREAERLEAISPREWDVAWFSRLRWLLAVQRDMAENAAQGFADAQSHGMPTPAEFLIGLIDRHGAAELILATLARADSDAALTIAEDSGRPDLMDIVAGAADDFGTLLAILARYEAGLRAWAQSLVHCALHERQIAEVLYASHEAIGPAPTVRGWETSFVTGGSVYGRLLDQVLADRSSWRAEDVVLLAKVAHIRPPQNAALAAIRVLPPALLSVLGALLALALAVTSLGEAASHSVSRLAAVGTVLVGAPLLFSLLTYVRDVMRGRVASRQAGEVDVDLSSLTITLERVARIAQGPRASVTARRGTEAARLSRVRVLEEILNLARYRFPGSPDRLDPTVVSLLLAGVSRDEVRALNIARTLRG